MLDRLNKIAFCVHILIRAILSPVAVGALALVEQSGKIVLVRHSYATGWYFPGGGVRRFEPPAEAVMRELQEEIGLVEASPPEFVAIYTRKAWFATNLIAFYRVRDARFAFKRNLEIRELVLADPAHLPPDVSGAIRRRVAEIYFDAPPSPYW